MKDIEKTNIIIAETMMTERECEKRLATEVGQLFTNPQPDNLQWQGTKVDLMEALYVAYVYGTLCDEQGIPLTYRNIVERACNMFHLSIPRNPYQKAHLGQQRMGVRRPPFIVRYQRQLSIQPQSQPFLQLVGH